MLRTFLAPSGDRGASASPTTPPTARSTRRVFAWRNVEFGHDPMAGSSVRAPISMWSIRTPIRWLRALRGKCSRPTPPARPRICRRACAAGRDAARYWNVHDRSCCPAPGSTGEQSTAVWRTKGPPLPDWSRPCGENSPSDTSRIRIVHWPKFRCCLVSRRQADSPAGTVSGSRRSRPSSAHAASGDELRLPHAHASSARIACDAAARCFCAGR